MLTYLSPAPILIIIIVVVLQKLLYGSVLPMMADQLDHVDSMEFVLPSFIALINRASVSDYQQYIKPHFKRVFRSTRSVQVNHSLNGSSPIHAADADATKLFCRVASASAVCIGHHFRPFSQHLNASTCCTVSTSK